jgi:4-diphosphocytidyl-2C-methyl-D-erythritol kinase
MNENTKLALNRWIGGAGPDSYHKLDMERFYEYVFQSVLNQDEISFEIIDESVKKNLEWADEYREEFVEKFLDLALGLVQFLDYLKDKGEII